MMLLYNIQLLLYVKHTALFDDAVCCLCVASSGVVDINTVSVCRFWEITSNTQSYHAVLLLASAWPSAFIQPCRVVFTLKFLRRMTSYLNVLEHSAWHPTCSPTVPVCFLCLVMLR